MEENKNVEIVQNNKEIMNEEFASTQQEVAEEIDSDFSDINKEEMKKNYIIIAILYFVVIILFILLVLGIKNQKDTVKDKIDSNKEVNDKLEQEKNEEVVIPEERPKNQTPEEIIIPDINNNNGLNDELNILDQI
ncbi:MAG: hypothetical protein IJE04_02730 [Bacilli bacterium]|nr:hypothetical protein [Bacilli bacterium]